MGGRVAEEVIFGLNQVTTGASSDLQQATNMARSMITQWGMSPTIGPMYHSERELEKLSPATRAAVESEVKELLVTAESNARRILNQHKDELHTLAQVAQSSRLTACRPPTPKPFSPPKAPPRRILPPPLPLPQGLLKHETLSRVEINDLLTSGGEARVAKSREKAKQERDAKLAK